MRADGNLCRNQSEKNQLDAKADSVRAEIFGLRPEDIRGYIEWEQTVICAEINQPWRACSRWGISPSYIFCASKLGFSSISNSLPSGIQAPRLLRNDDFQEKL